jgi:copper homeostasis protein
MKLEICVDSVAAAIAACHDGADRLELCSRLDLDGLTPSAELLQAVQSKLDLPLMVMIRPQSGEFCATPTEFEIMSSQARWAKNAGAAGLVFGLLLDNHTLDYGRCAALVEIAAPLPCTFHRAFDRLLDPLQALVDLQNLGLQRILCSGCLGPATAGLSILQQLVRQAEGSMQIMPGGGVRPHNADQILAATGATELHSSATQGWSDWRRSRPGSRL